MKTERFKIGPFSFTFRGDRVWWRYKQNHFGILIKASGITSISTVSQLRSWCDDQKSEWSKDGLRVFVNWHMGEIPGAKHWADSYSWCKPLKMES